MDESLIQTETSNEFVSLKDELEVQSSGDSLMHQFWRDKIWFLYNANESKGSLKLEHNRYFRPDYFDWLKKNCHS